MTMVANGFWIEPYKDGLFDVGDSETKQGWNGGASYSTTLFGGVPPCR